jgi:subtilisin family serine protease
LPTAPSVRRSVAIGAALILTALAGVPAHAAAPQASSAAPRPDRPAWDLPSLDDPNRLIVTFRPRTAARSREAAIAAAGTVRAKDLGDNRAVAVRAARGDPATAAAALRADPHVLGVSVDHQRYRDADPTSEPYWHELWGLDNAGQGVGGVAGTGGAVDADIDAREALGITTGDPRVVVAVIDDGVDFGHPDLARRAWTNPGESGNGRETNGIDDDGNGYIDDVHGWDFCHDDNSVHDFGDDWHGTHVAGTIAASLDGIGVVGVAPNVSIMALKFLGNDPACGHDSQAIEAIAYAKSFGVRIANNSWGGRGRQQDALPLYDAIRTSGMLFVASAGNDAVDNDLEATPTLPASFDLPNVVSVAAIDNTGRLASFSNFGPRTVDVAAPGAAILSALPADPDNPEPGWGWLSGTSMASPHVTGTAALVASVLPSVAADPIAMKARLLGSAKRDGATAGLTVSGRVIDAFRALDRVAPRAQAPASFSFVVGSTVGSTTAVTRIGWPDASDDRSGVVGYGLETRARNGPWQTVMGSTAAPSALRNLTFWTPLGFHVRARDGAGNWGSWSEPAVILLSRYQESAPQVRYRGSWHQRRIVSASRGRTRFATRRGASVTFRFTGRAFAAIAPRGPTRGSARLYVDGVYVSTISLHRSTAAARVVVAARSWSVSGSHTVKLVVVGTARHPRVDIDAFAVLR